MHLISEIETTLTQKLIQKGIGQKLIQKSIGN